MLNPKYILICILVAGFVFTLPACSNVTDTKASTSATSTSLKSWYKDEQIADSFDNAMKIGMEGLRSLSGEEC